MIQRCRKRTRRAEPVTLPPPINSKRQMYDLCYRGRFGNYPNAWRSVEEVLASGFKGHVSIRSLVTSNPVKLYHVPVDELAARVMMLSDQHRRGGLMFSESPPDEWRTLQGEWDGYRLTYTFNRQPMRLALLDDRHDAVGLMARGLLKRYCDPADLDWLDELHEYYPHHTLEFSCFTHPVGKLQTKMFLWECRNY